MTPGCVIVLLARTRPHQLDASGLPTDLVRFYGRARTASYADPGEKANFPETLVFYESPNRLIKTLAAMRDVWGERQAVVGLEVTKLFEEFARGTLGELVAHFSHEPIRGEVTLMVHGKR
ncbi:MAG: hypothetical protein LC121_23230 [Anaerolineae bacterium]|nr:hypothetical protein [Anaerolineae bacterium]